MNSGIFGAGYFFRTDYAKRPLSMVLSVSLFGIYQKKITGHEIKLKILKVLGLYFFN